MKKFAEVEGLRGVAIVLVLIFHFDKALLPSGFIGVDVFFVISGFVIFTSVIRRQRAGESFSFLGFTLRRLKRLSPTILAGFVLTLPLLALTQSPLGAFDNSVATGLSSLLGFSNGVIQYLSGGYFGDSAEVNGYLHTWSLSVEIQFYLVFAILMTSVYLALTKFTNSLAALRLLALIVTIPSIAILTGSVFLSLPYEELGLYGYYSPIVRAWQFGIGGLIATASGFIFSPKGKTFISSLSLILLIFLSLTDFHQFTIFGTFLSSAIASVAAVFLILASGSGSTVGSILSSGPLLHLGKISYALYVVHWPILVAANALNLSFVWSLLSLIVSYLMAVLVYEGLERPISEKRVFRFNTLSLTSAVLLVLSLASTGVTYQQVISGNSDEIERLKSQVQERHLPARHDWLCATGPLTQENFERCQVGKLDTGIPPIYLVGDSQAGMYSEAMLAIAENSNTSLIMTTTTACPFYISNETSSRCEDFVSDSVEFLTGAEPGKVVIAFSQANDGNENRESFEEGLRKIADSGHQIFLLEAVPHFPDFVPLACSKDSVTTEDCFVSMSESEASAQLESIDLLFQDAEKKGLARVLHIRDAVCKDGECLTLRDGNAVYRDSSHLSVASSEWLAPHIRGQLKD